MIRPQHADQHEYFERVAPEWDSMRRGFFSDAVREAAMDALDVKPGRRAADIGAGTGFVSDGLLRRGLHTIAIDESPAMLDEMRKTFGGRHDLELLRVDSARLPLPDRSVDYVFANMYLHHVESPREAIAEMARILAPDGRLAITDLDAHDFDFLRTEHYDRWLGFDRRQVESWLLEAALVDTDVSPVGSTCDAVSEEGTVAASITIFLATARRE
jgi:ubiquinone/menaquinone biosynthesis C-methylase UbiE